MKKRDNQKTIRIGGASAFYGDSQLAARQLVDKGDVDYLVFDYLAEATMAILARAAIKNSELGYAIDFVKVAMNDVIRDCATNNIKVVANAGGVNVPACVAALQDLCKELDLNLQIAGVYGDDLSDLANGLRAKGQVEMQTAEELPKNLASINAYLGAAPIADALAAGADIVVTGRIVDSALVLGPLMYEFSWPVDDYDTLAQGSLAGHVLECGAQCTGGNFTDWHLVPDFADMSYPIAEVQSNGEFVISIPEGTGGLATVGSVAEQIVYEIGDPQNYLLPDVACDFSRVTLTQIAKDRVSVAGARGRAPGNQYKVCATWQDGYRLLSSFYMAGPRAVDKARSALNAWIRRTQKVMVEKGWGDYRRLSIEIAGAEDIYGVHSRAQQSREVMAKVGLHHDNYQALTFAAMEMAYLATSGPPALSGFAAGRARPQPLMRIHSSLIDKQLVPVTIQLNEGVIMNKCYTSESSDVCSDLPKVIAPAKEEVEMTSVLLEKLAYARSGDKGDNANIGVICRQAEFLPYISQQLTAEVVANYFAHLIEGDVERFYLPGIMAFNFYLTEALGGGGTASIRLDAQAKTYAQMLLSLSINIPSSLTEKYL